MYRLSCGECESFSWSLESPPKVNVPTVERTSDIPEASRDSKSSAGLDFPTLRVLIKEGSASKYFSKRSTESNASPYGENSACLPVL